MGTLGKNARRGTSRSAVITDLTPPTKKTYQGDADLEGPTTMLFANEYKKPDRAPPVIDSAGSLLPPTPDDQVHVRV